MGKSVIIVGGGCAGLAAGCSLAEKGYQVSLFESRPFLGGRLHSFTDPKTGDSVDNGQHLFAGFYYETFKLLSLIGSSDHIAMQKNLEIDFLNKSGAYSDFRCPKLPSPLNLLAGLATYKEFPKVDLLKFALKSRRLRKTFPEDFSAANFLEEMGMSNQALHTFFRPLVLATLNADLEEVSGVLFQNMMNLIMSVPREHAVLAYATVGFEELLARPAADFIFARGGVVYAATHIAGVNFTDNKIGGVVDERGKVHKADAYIFALMPDQLVKIFPEDHDPCGTRWSYAPIVSVNIWYEQAVMDKMMVGLLDGNFHWIFDKKSIIKEPNKHRYVTLLASSAYDMISMPKKEIIKRALADMEKYFPTSRGVEIKRTQVIKERRATVLITPLKAKRRPTARTQWKNAFLAGDWTDTGLPATVESAVKSGFMAADAINGGAK